MDIKEIQKQEFNELAKTADIICPEKDHIIFDNFYKMTNEYENTTYVKSTIINRFNDKKFKIKKEIEKLQEDIDFYNQKTQEKESCEKRGDISWTPSKEDKKRYDSIDIQENYAKMDELKKELNIIKQWKTLILGKNSNIKNVSGYEKINNPLFDRIVHEFFNIYNLISNIKPANQFKATILVPSFRISEMLPLLAQELDSQIGLCSERNTKEFYYNDGQGRFIPYELDYDLYNSIISGTKFVKADGKFREGLFVSIKDLFEKIPQWIKTTRVKNQNLVGFRNCFYNIKDRKIEKLQIKIPLLPLRNTKTELYLDEELSGGAMERIFNECFSEEDREALLAYIGCCLYDKGYTQRQESIFFLSKGELGKTTFIKAICEIFYSCQSQIVTKLSDEKFGLSMFGDSDCIIIDEIQGANEDFVEILKTISTGADLAVEKKNKDTINIPAETVPRCWFIGNQFPKKVYDASAGEGVLRRILTIIPKASIKDLGYKWQDLVTDECKRWIVQQATKTYIKLGLDKNAEPIPSISQQEKIRRIEKCTFPERCSIKEHFEIQYDDMGDLDVTSNYLSIKEVHNFIYNDIRDNMIESTIAQDNHQTFIMEIKEALELPKEYHTTKYAGSYYAHGIIPKSEKAKELIKQYHITEEGMTQVVTEEEKKEKMENQTHFSAKDFN